MAIAYLKKLVLFARAHEQQQVLDLLQMSGVVHLAQGDVFLPEEARLFFGRPAASTVVADQQAALEKRLLTLQAAIEDLAAYEPPEGLAARLAQPREGTRLQDFYALADYDEAPVIRQCNELAAQRQDLQAEIRRLHHVEAQCAALVDLTAPLETFRDTPRCFVVIFRTDRSLWEQQQRRLAAALSEESICYVLAAAREHVVVCTAGRLKQRQRMEAWMEAEQVERLDVSGMQGTAAENVARLQRESEALQRQVEAVEGRRQALVAHLPRLRRAYDYWNTRLEQLRQWRLLRESRYTTMVSGWIRAEDVAALEALFTARALDVCFWVEDPMPEDTPPVDYDNPHLLRPFEFVSDLYSRPRYREIDPTPYVGVFFPLFFAICLTDAGYGLLLALMAFLALRRFAALAPGSRKLIRILLFGGLCTTVVGLLTGGFFGITFEALPGPLRSLRHVVLLNPMTNQMGFLMLALALGVVQVAFGIFLKLRWNLRHHRPAEAWLDQAPWLAIIAGVLLLVAAGVLDAPWLRSLGFGFLLLAAVVILLFAGRAATNPAKRLVLGLFSLYQLSGMFGDVLSYVRLFALGLATGVIASVVNFIAELTLHIPYVGFVVMPVVLVFGHLLNIAINALGGFIHTTRLQFVEFFGKFYEGGGAPFDAFQLKTKYTNVLRDGLPSLNLG